MKVLMLNGSRNEKGCTYTAMTEIGKELTAAGIDYEIVHVGKDAVNGNIDAAVKAVAAKMKESDGLVIGSPVYYASPSGEVVAFLDRLFGVAGADLRHKPGAVIASARRAGTTATLEVLSKYIQYAEMPLVNSNYWTMVHGSRPEDVLKDEEGMQIMHLLGKNMAWLMQCIEAGKKAGVQEPAPEKKVYTNFIR